MAPSDPLKDSVRCTAVTATLEAGTTCPYGVTGVMRIGAVMMTGGGSSSCSIADHGHLVSQRLMKRSSTHRILRATLVRKAALEPQVIHLIFGIN